MDGLKLNIACPCGSIDAQLTLPAPTTADAAHARLELLDHVVLSPEGRHAYLYADQLEPFDIPALRCRCPRIPLVVDTAALLGDLSTLNINDIAAHLTRTYPNGACRGAALPAPTAVRDGVLSVAPISMHGVRFVWAFSVPDRAALDHSIFVDDYDATHHPALLDAVELGGEVAFTMLRAIQAPTRPHGHFDFLAAITSTADTLSTPA